MSQREEEIAAARWLVDHPDTGPQQKRLLRALLEEIDAGRARVRAAIRVAARFRAERGYYATTVMLYTSEQLDQLGRC